MTVLPSGDVNVRAIFVTFTPATSAHRRISLHYPEQIVERHGGTSKRENTMQITLYRRSYPIADSPVALSFVSHSVNQRHTFTVGGKVYEAERSELRVVVPDDAKLDAHSQLLCWAGDKGLVNSTAKEVFDLAETGTSGFRLM